MKDDEHDESHETLFYFHYIFMSRVSRINYQFQGSYHLQECFKMQAS